ncbi:MAG TPA: site-specific integrase [Ignavibacteria bacterium]|nr:site-specific integrase [Ignavibacteria bacterium]
MATLYEKRGRWYIDYVLNGKKKTKNTKLPATKIFKTEAEKIKLKIELLIKSNENKFITKTEGMSLETASEKYVEYLLSKSKNHLLSFKTAFSQISLYISPQKNIKDIIKEDIKLLISELKTNRSIETVRSYLRYFKIFFNFLVEEEYILKSPIPKKFMPRSPKKLIKTFDSNMIENILSLAKQRDHKYYCFLKMLLLTGQRPGDVLNFRFKDMNLEKDLLFIKISKTDKQIYFPIYNELRKFILTDIMQYQIEPEDLIFEGFNISIVSKRLIRIKKQLNIKERGYDLKTFRKTFGTHLASKGIDRTKVADLLGHESVATTIKYYAKVKAENLKEDLNKVFVS